MNFKKTSLCTALGVALGGVAMSAQANLTTGSQLQFDAGGVETVGCTYGNFTGSSCTYGGNQITTDVTDIGGSYFRMNQGGTPANEKVPMSQFAPITLGSAATSSGQHTGSVDGTESPSIDNAWNFFFNTGMHSLSSGVSVMTDLGSTKLLDFSGWGVNWGNYGPGGVSGPTIAMAGTATIVCSTSSCSAGSTYALDMDVHVPVAFGSVPYSLHLEGSVVPVPAAVWLFGSGLLGLAGVARRKVSK